MAVVRVDVKDQYGSGELWSDAGNETEALEEARRWCEANPPWEIRGGATGKGHDGHYKIALVRAYGGVS